MRGCLGMLWRIIEKNLVSTEKGAVPFFLKKVSPAFFERIVVKLLVKMGYGGIDGIIKEDRLGLDVIYIQAKC